MSRRSSLVDRRRLLVAGGLIILPLLILPGCGGSPGDEAGGIESTSSPTTEPAATPTQAPPEAPPEPSPVPTRTPRPTTYPITSAEPLHGLWTARTANKTSFFYFHEDGTFSYYGVTDQEAQRAHGTKDLNAQQVIDSRTVWGEYWFEDGRFHIQDVEIVPMRAWDICEADEVGIYEVVAVSEREVQFDASRDECMNNSMDIGTRRWVLEGEPHIYGRVDSP